jgi:hypothetical protein
VAITSLSGINKTGMQIGVKKNGKRSNSDNPMNRKQATKSIEVQQQPSKNQKMVALTNKLNSIYSSN